MFLWVCLCLLTSKPLRYKTCFCCLLNEPIHISHHGIMFLYCKLLFSVKLKFCLFWIPLGTHQSRIVTLLFQAHRPKGQMSLVAVSYWPWNGAAVWSQCNWCEVGCDLQSACKKEIARNSDIWIDLDGDRVLRGWASQTHPIGQVTSGRVKPYARTSKLYSSLHQNWQKWEKIKIGKIAFFNAAEPKMAC